MTEIEDEMNDRIEGHAADIAELTATVATLVDEVRRLRFACNRNHIHIGQLEADLLQLRDAHNRLKADVG